MKRSNRNLNNIKKIIILRKVRLTDNLIAAKPNCLRVKVYRTMISKRLSISHSMIMRIQRRKPAILLWLILKIVQNTKIMKSGKIICSAVINGVRDILFSPLFQMIKWWTSTITINNSKTQKMYCKISRGTSRRRKECVSTNTLKCWIQIIRIRKRIFRIILPTPIVYFSEIIINNNHNRISSNPLIQIIKKN